MYTQLHIISLLPQLLPPKSTLFPYTTLSDLPVLGVTASLEKATAKQIAAWQQESIVDLQNALRSVLAGLHRYDAHVLQIVDRKGFAYSEPAEFLSFLITG